MISKNREFPKCSGGKHTILLLVFWTIFGTACKTSIINDRFEPPPGFYPQGRFSVKVDPRVELFSILFRLAGGQGV